MERSCMPTARRKRNDNRFDHPAFRILADPTRARILTFLLEPIQSCCSRDDGVCGCDLETYLGLSQPTVSHHMKALVEVGLVTAEKRGRWVYYDLVADTFEELATILLRAATEMRTANQPSPKLAKPSLTSKGSARA